MAGDKFWLYTDGASRGNPGRAAIGAVLFWGSTSPEKVVAELSRAIGHATNNEAEYRAVIEGLKMAAEHHPAALAVYSDSLVVVRQLQGKYRVRAPNLVPLNREARELLGRFSDVQVEHLPRKHNRFADRLANLALDRMADPPNPA